MEKHTLTVGDRLPAWNGATYEIVEAECVGTGPQGQTAWIVDMTPDEPETCLVLAGGQVFCDPEFYCGDEKHLCPEKGGIEQFLALMRYVDMATGIPPANVADHWPVPVRGED